MVNGKSSFAWCCSIQRVVSASALQMASSAPPNRTPVDVLLAPAVAVVEDGDMDEDEDTPAAP